MRTARMARPGSFYGASVSSKTSETAHEAINPIDFDEIAEVVSTKAI